MLVKLGRSLGQLVETMRPLGHEDIASVSCGQYATGYCIPGIMWMRRGHHLGQNGESRVSPGSNGYG